MRAVFLRRMMVLGVCALGVSALYLVPGLSGRSPQVGVPASTSDLPGPSDPASSEPGPDSASVAARSPQRTVATRADHTRTRPDTPTSDSTASLEQPDRPSAAQDAPRRMHSTPFDGSTPVDVTPPAAVTELAAAHTDPDQARIAWAPSRDDAGPVRYRVWLNGYEVAQTTTTETTLDWFNDDSVQQVVVVRAVDDAGNLSRTTALLLTRPEADAASVEATPSASPSQPVASPSSPPSSPPADPTPATSPTSTPGADRIS